MRHAKSCQLKLGVLTPPSGDNKPQTSEIKNCNPYLKAEINTLPKSCNLLALGKIAHDAIARAYNLKLSALKFGHAAEHILPDGRRLFDSYHCSRYNTQIRRLTEKMLKDVLSRAASSSQMILDGQ